MPTARAGERARLARRERRARRAELAAVLEAPAAPLTWRAGWRGKALGAVLCLGFVTLSAYPEGASLAEPRPSALVFALWTPFALAWFSCRVGIWRITADRDGVHLRRMWRTRLLSWSEIRHVELRHDGSLEFFGPDTPEPMAGLFAPPWLARRTGGTGAEAADLITVMAEHPRLRPAGQSRPVPGFARWVLLLAAVIFVIGQFRTW
ncbi:PH domain-containing protein [Streptomyces tagetis]|uniref:PH domain-containing protein n=1 Tax=Streptomyces tagetis TaxID=2820809 RepID=A0A940XMG3_9ACTN|nr:PH domain-containing protein [Streptomyces sp. RG38]MBQ0826418.1 PH domain-containing protein [Streptomyces sp. RG38]